MHAFLVCMRVSACVCVCCICQEFTKQEHISLNHSNVYDLFLTSSKFKVIQYIFVASAYLHFMLDLFAYMHLYLHLGILVPTY